MIPNAIPTKSNITPTTVIHVVVIVTVGLEVCISTASSAER